MGVVEMVDKFLEEFPAAIHHVDYKGRNVLHTAAENRRYRIFKSISAKYDGNTPLRRRGDTGSSEHFRRFDDYGNTPLHLAATLGGKIQPWPTSSALLQMLLELNWFEKVSDTMPPDLSTYKNIDSKTPKDIFTATHKDLIKEGAAQLTSMSNSCSVVAGLIATVAFATAATIPSGFTSENGTPVYEGKIAFEIFTISSFIALCLSIISLITFLGILNYPYQESDFGNHLPNKMKIGFISLLLSIACMFASFCASHFFLLRDMLPYGAYLVYVPICFLITVFAIFQFPLFFDLMKYTITSELPDN